jgi:ring-1,2-phenylacetyl-CoA epoxidase subunit PaaD
MEDSLDLADIWRLLEEVKDPEIPVVSVVELGMVRSVGISSDRVIISFTPTFAGCPAQRIIQDQIRARLEQASLREVEVRTSLAPPWTSDWISPPGRQKLADFGLAPPPYHSGNIEAALSLPVTCPYCRSENTALKNDFGATLCRALYVCNHCNQPFEQFKPL